MDKEKRTTERLQASLAQVRQLLAKESDGEEYTGVESGGKSASREIFASLQALLSPLHPADIAYILESLPLVQRQLVWDAVKSEDDGDILLEVSDAVRETLIETMDEDELLAAVGDLDADELAELAPDLPHQVVCEVMDAMDEEERAQVQSVLSYDDNQVGAVMDFDVVKIRADVTCEVVLRYLRRFENLPEQTDKIFVVDDRDVVKGILFIRKLLVSDPEAVVVDVMSTEFVSFHPEDNAEEAAQAFERYDLVTAPVVDKEGKLVGRLTIDEIVDVIREESETEILNMAGLQESEDLFAPVLNSVKNRGMWLAINLCTALIASRVIGLFEGTIGQLVALAALMPIVAGIGGNSGNQTITMIVRAMAMGQMNVDQVWRLWRKEFGVAILNGIIWGGIIGLIGAVLYGNVSLGAVLFAAMILNLILAATMGVFIPVFMQKIGKDPALGSSVLITACTDSGGFFIFLGLASLLLL